jgi:hypothetical protein
MKFVVYNFLFQIILSMKFKFRKLPQMEKLPTCMKVVDLRKLWNFVVDKFLIWIRLEPKKWFTLSVV